MKQKLENIQAILREAQLDGWLLYDFRRSNNLACRFLEIPDTQLLTRRFFYWIPSKGDPLKIVHAIENPLDHLPGKILKFCSWNQIEEYLGNALKGSRQVAMEYSPRNAIPTVSKVDAGTIDLIRSFGVNVVSSCDILQKFTSVLSPHQVETHFKAAQILDQTAEKTWKMIEMALKNKMQISEYDVQTFILKEFESQNCITSDPPICAVNENSANPHYCPQKNSSKKIKAGDFILLDLWCKLMNPLDAIYADITRIGIAAGKATAKQEDIFNLVRKAQLAATDLVQARFNTKKPLQGWEVDQTARHVIESAGYGEYFIHRTGHSIDTSDHGSGTNMDNLETQDQRLVLAGTCFSIEPGIYLPGEFGVRLEYDIYVSLENEVKVTGGIQNSITTLNI